MRYNGPENQPTYTENGWIGPPPPRTRDEQGRFVTQAHRAAPRRSRGYQVVLAIMVGMLVLFCGGGMVVAVLTYNDSSEPFVVGPAPSSSNYANVDGGQHWQLVMQVTGSGKADISYNISGTGGQDLGVALPWEKKLGPFDGFTIVSLVAQAKGGTTSDVVHGKILFADKPPVECHGQGMFAVATCTGSNG